MTHPRTALALSAALLLPTLAACAAPEDTASSTSSTSSSATSSGVGTSGLGTTSSSADCTKDALQTKEAGTLTIGTDKPAYEPWFSGDDPTNGEGYESAVAYAIAEELGYAKDEVSWVTVPFSSAYAPGEKKFDLDLNQVSISESRKKAVDFSSGYYDVRQAVVTYAGSPIEKAGSVADLKDAKLGAMVGSTSLTAVTDVIGASDKPSVFDTNDAAVQALQNKQVDGIVVDLPTAFYMTAAQLDDGVIAGQLPAGEGEVEQFGAVLDKGSPLTACVSQAVDALREDGTLDELATEYLAGAGAPELK